MNTQEYVGRELDVFAHATHWKQYWSSLVLALVRDDVLEVGAGLRTIDVLEHISDDKAELQRAACLLRFGDVPGQQKRKHMCVKISPINGLGSLNRTRTADLERFWIGHENETVGDGYSKRKEDGAFRLEQAETVGLGFALPPQITEVVRISVKMKQDLKLETQPKLLNREGKYGRGEWI